MFLLCFSVDNIHSYDNITSKWSPEVTHHCPKAKLVLVGTKTDLRPTDRSIKPDKEYVTKSMGKKLASKIKAYKYIECSAKNMSGVNEVSIHSYSFCILSQLLFYNYFLTIIFLLLLYSQVFKEAVRVVVNPPPQSSCNLL